MGDALQLGVYIVAAVFVGAGMGWYLDGWLGTSPWLTIVFLFFGVAAAGRELWRTAQRELKRDYKKAVKEEKTSSEDENGK